MTTPTNALLHRTRAAERFNSQASTRVAERPLVDTEAPRALSSRNEPALPTDALAFPLSALVGSVGDLAKVLAAGSEVPEEFCFACGLTALGAICATGMKLNVGSDVEPRLYTVLLGGSADVKKSTAMRKVLDFFENLEVPNKPHFNYGVGSAEGLARLAADTPNLLLGYDELKALVDKFRVQGSPLLAMVTSLYENHHWHNVTKRSNASVTVNDVRLSLIGCCTTDTYASLWRQEAIAIGLPNRLLIVNADRKAKVAWPKKPDEAQLKDIASRLRQQIAKLPFEFDIAGEARDLWERWYIGLPNSEHCRRLDTIGFRLLPLIALTTDKDAIDAETVATVLSILDYEFRIRTVTDPIDADDRIATLEQKIRRQLQARGALSDRELRRRTNADREGLWAYNAAKTNLTKANDIKLTPTGLYCTCEPSSVLSSAVNMEVTPAESIN